MPSCRNNRQASYRTSLFTLWTPCCASAIQNRISNSIALSPKDMIRTFGVGEVRILCGRVAAPRISAITWSRSESCGTLTGTFSRTRSSLWDQFDHLMGDDVLIGDEELSAV